MSITTKQEFQDFVENYWKDKEKPKYWGLAKAYIDFNGSVVAYKVLTLNVEENYGALAAIEDGISKKLDTLSILSEYFSWLDDEKFHANLEALDSTYLTFSFDEDKLKEKPEDLLDVHIRLALISRRIKEPNTINLDGAFGLLPNLVWTMEGPFTIKDWNEEFISSYDNLKVECVDKFPPFFLWNPVPEGIRVANTDMVRAGAYLAEGTTVMHYGFVNFNAGTLGASMVEGRISAGTVVKSGTDIGAGAGFLGTLSGGNDIKMSTGENCLVGAMAEVGIPLGDNCTVAVGTCFAPGTPVFDLDEGKEKKAIELANEDNLLIWRNSQNGRIEVQRKKVDIQLNEELHKN